MATNSQIAVTEGSGKNIATYSISETTTKELQRTTLNDSAGVEQPIGAATETAPTTDTASSGLNGRLQRVAQRLTSMIALLPTALGAGGGLKVDGSGTALPVSGTITASNTAGDVASGASDSGNPVKIGGLGKTANPTAVTDGQRVAALFDKLGKQVVVGAVRDLKGQQQTTITSSTAETTVVTAVASTFLDVYGVVVTNTSTTVTKVTFKDSTAGTTRFVIEVPPTDTRGLMLPVDSAIPQATVNNNWTATCGTSVASVEITMLYVKNL